MRKAFLTVACYAILTVPFVLSQSPPAYASDPRELNNRGNDASFPTWHAGVSTKLCVWNRATNFPAQTTVTAGSAREVIDVPMGQTVCIDRYWAGIWINVVNSSPERADIPITVWTE